MINSKNLNKSRAKSVVCHMSVTDAKVTDTDKYVYVYGDTALKVD